MYIPNTLRYPYNILIINNIYNIYSMEYELGGTLKNN